MLMRVIFLTILFYLSLSLYSQAVVGKPWTVEAGISSANAFKTSYCYNLRYISPRFKWSNYELNAEEEKRAEEFKNTRLMAELLYNPPFEVLGIGLNVQSRLLRYKRLLSMDLYGGMKVFIKPGPDFVRIPYLKAGKELWYLNMGLLLQLNMGVISPFADIGGDKIITVGAEFNFHKIYKRPKGRYRLHAKPMQQSKE